MRELPINYQQQQENQIDKMDHDDEKINRSKSSETWECEMCSFKNLALLPNCQMCDSSRPASFKRQELSVESGFECHTCKFLNKKLMTNCENCGEVLIPDDSEQDVEPSPWTKKKTQQSKKLMACPSCGFENDPSNSECVSCQNKMSQPSASLFPMGKRRAPRASKIKKPRRYGSGVRGDPCPYCGLINYGGFAVGGLTNNHDICPKMPIQELQIRFKTMERKYCSFCYQKFDSSDKSFIHDQQCQSRSDFFSTESETFQRTTKLQKQAMIYMHKKSEKFHWMAENSLLQRIKKLGFNSNDLQNLHHYIVNYAPIIIHMHANNHMQFFVKDTHYRNQFQTRKSSGSLSESSRTNWENRMFDNLHSTATPFERVKYGTINFTNDPKGVRACSGYGQSYFLLKSHVRNRCTVTDMDSSSPTSTIGTFQFCYHVLNKLPDAELQAAFQGSKANEVASTMMGTYKQIQIHGPVEFKKDIQRVYINKVELADPKILDMVKKFCKDNEVQYEIFEYEPPAAVLGAAPTVGIGSLMGITYIPPSFPIIRPSTTHLFGGGRRALVPSIIPLAPIADRQEEQGVDYI